MKNIKQAIFSLSMVLLLSACASPSTPKGNPNLKLIDPSDTSMLTENCKAYVDAMREQEKQLEDPYQYDDLFGTEGVNIDEDKLKVPMDERVYLDKGDVNGKNDTVNGQVPDRSDKNTGVDLSFEVTEDFEAEKYLVYVSDNSRFTNPKILEAKNNSVNVKNLFVNTKYYWKVVADDSESEVKTFTTGDYPRWISARPLYNVRDTGGYMTYSGKRVKQGMFYRGGEITTRSWGNNHLLTYTDNPYEGSSKQAFRDDMGMVGGTELDLRGSGDIGDGYKAPCAFAENGDIGYVQKAIKSYHNTFRETRSVLKEIFNDVLSQEANYPIYYHCFGGADRTGTLAFLVNGLLGVSYTDLVIDFELTSYSSINSEHIRCHIPGFQHSYDYWPNLINQLKTDSDDYYSWDDDALLMDNIKNYLMYRCDVTEDAIKAIEKIMLEK